MRPTTCSLCYGRHQLSACPLMEERLTPATPSYVHPPDRQAYEAVVMEALAGITVDAVDRLSRAPARANTGSLDLF